MPQPRLLAAVALVVACTRNPAPGGGGNSLVPGGDAGTILGEGSTTRAVFEVSPRRQLDLVFLVDNSDSMAPKQEILARDFPALTKRLERLPGGVPDLRIAFVSSNFGAGPNIVSPACPPYGDRGRFLVKPGCGLDENQFHWLEYDPQQKAKNFPGELATTFACLTKLGIGGCGYEHQLQALRSALYDVNPENRGFLRPDAYLGIVIVSDEDDCSAEPFATVFDEPIPSGEAASLRCSTLGHVCQGQEVPARDGFSAPLDSCKPYERQQDPAKDSHPDTDPVRKQRLINVSEMIDFIKAKKPGHPERIVVSAIMGWPRALEGQTATQAAEGREYKIALVMKEHPARVELDNVPICESPAAGRANAGVRLKAFVDGFAENGAAYSVCQEDLTPVMTDIGGRLAGALDHTCLPRTVVDTGRLPEDVPPDCSAEDLVPQPNGTYARTAVPACTPGGPHPCWRSEADPQCPSAVRLIRDAGDMTMPLNTLISYSCRDPRRPGTICQAPSCPQKPISGSPFGQPCNVFPAPGSNQSVWRGEAPECPSGVCINTAVAPELGVTVPTRPWCTQGCASDADCTGGETAMPGSSADVRCRKGFSCGVGFAVGPLACRKMCLCRDFLPPGPLQPPSGCAP